MFNFQLDLALISRKLGQIFTVVVTLSNKMRIWLWPVLASTTAQEYDYFFTEYDPDTGEPISERKATAFEICGYRKSENGYCAKGRCQSNGECVCRPPYTFYNGDCVWGVKPLSEI